MRLLGLILTEKGKAIIRKIAERAARLLGMDKIVVPCPNCSGKGCNICNFAC